MRSFSMLLPFLVLSAADVFAQTPDLDKTASIELSTYSPLVDGRIDTDEWSDATLIDDLYQVRPDEYAEVSEKTEFFVKYDKDAIYVAGKFHEKDPNQITAQISRQGANNRNDDRMMIFLDPYNSQRSGYIFSLNLNEVRTEGIYVNTTQYADDWRGIWEGRAVRTDYGWSAEMAIPFKTLTFEQDSDAWGFNVYRHLARNGEMFGWVSKNRSTDASVAAELTGIRGVEQGIGLDLVPSISLNNQRSYNPRSSSFDFEPSLDLFYKITSSLNGSLTFNTDFSATEVDDRQVDLSQFSLFFPEKRDFFLREFDVFDFGGIGANFRNSGFSGPERENARPFFSRNIGLGPAGEPVDIIAGAKVSGKMNGYEVGALVVQQDEFQDVDASTLFVGRFAADVLEESSLGAIFTYGDSQSNIDNSLAGVDFRYRNSRLGPGKRMDANLWYQKTDTEGLEGRDSAMGAMFSMPNSGGWRGLAQYQRVEENFNPALGFVSRVGVELKRGILGYTFRYDNHPWLRSIYTGLENRQWDFLSDGRLQSSKEEIPVRIRNARGDNLHIIFLRFGEGIYTDASQPFDGLGITLPHDSYEWERAGIIFDSSEARPYDIRLSVFDGDYFTGERFSRDIDLGWRPSPRIRLELGYSYWDVRFPEGDFRLRQANARTEWVFNSTLSWVNVVQYDNISGNLGLNSRLHWTPKAGQDVFFVVNHNFNELENDEFISEANEITLKASYTFRF